MIDETRYSDRSLEFLYEDLAKKCRDVADALRTTRDPENLRQADTLIGQAQGHERRSAQFHYLAEQADIGNYQGGALA